MNYYFDGDLCQMAEQKNFLQRRGFNIIMSDVYPTVKTEEEFKKALRLIWDNKIEGWWHYIEYYVKYGICSRLEFRKAL